MGDSNLSRILQYSNPDLQIESYPGAQFRHIEAIVAKFKPTSTVEKVILAAGLNNREQKPKETAIKQMQKALRMAKTTFPAAEIWIPIINYSKNLPKRIQDNVAIMNEHIRTNMPFLPPLPDSDFETEKDNIHWTAVIATAMLNHWTKKLNLTAH